MQGPQQFSHAAGGEWGFREARCPGAVPVGLELLLVAKHVFPWLCSGVSPGLRVQAGSLPAPSPAARHCRQKGRDRFQGKGDKQPKTGDQLEPTGSTHPREKSVIEPGSKLVSFVVVWT